MEAYVALKLLHILGASILFGTGLGIAFFMFWADRTGDPVTIFATARIVVIADYLFTLLAVILQPITGTMLILKVGYQFTESWIILSIGLFILIGLCWLPVVYLQTRVRDLAKVATIQNSELPPEYHKVMAQWFWLGWPAFIGVIAIFWLMIRRPVLW